MQVHIHEVTSSVRMVDGNSLLTPSLLARIVAATTEAMQQGQMHEQRARRDTRVSSKSVPGSWGCGGGDR
jgi:hypothetical protein